MDLTKYFPSLKEFTDQITVFHFSQEDIDFQHEMALKVGYKSWGDYLQYFFHNFCNIYDLDSLTNEFGSDFNKTNKFIGSFPILLNKHINIALKEKMQPILDMVKTFPIEDRNRIENFEDKIALIFTSLILNKYKNDPIALELVKAFEIDFKNQFAAINPNPLNENAPSIVESILMPNTNSVIQKYSNQNFYFPSKKLLLKQLHDFLLKDDCIEANDDFEKTFELKIRPAAIKSTLWLADGTELFYLLYCLNDNDDYVRGQSIDKIANQLFTFKKPKTDNLMRTNFVKAFKQFENPDYIKKKMSRITNILQKLSV
ncbi:MAG: hypothetical protein ACXVPU_02155 [Bacteroidia bacterium]